MSYLAPRLDESGIHLPTYQERLDSLIEGYKGIFGSDLYMGEDTMDYQALAIVAKCWDDLTSVILDSYNSRDPNYATGTALDLLLPLNGIIRREASSSTVILTLTSAYTSLELPAGMQAMDADGYIWEIEEPVSFDGSYTAEAKASCLTKGAIAAGVGTITVINTPHAGWLSVTNLVAAVPGRNVETDAEVRIRRSLSMALPARGTVASIRAALLSIDDVESVNIFENYEDGPAMFIDRPEYNIPGHSICVVVQGGSNEEIAKAIWLKKSPGTGLIGPVTANYTDEFGVINPVRFRRATIVQVGVRITFNVFSEFDKEAMFNTSVPAAVREYINNLEIGDNLIASLLNGPIYNANTLARPVFSVTNIEVKESGGAYTQDKLSAYYLTLWKISDAVTVTHSNNTWTVTMGVS